MSPACHYASGGVATDLWGRSTLPGLYATGEVACSGVHGANRLASNSLLEGLVFSRRIAEVLPTELRPWEDPASDGRPASLVDASARRPLQEEMTARVGVLRTADGLVAALERLDDLLAEPAEVVGQDAWEASNLVTVSALLAEAALRREETRGSHWREDFPERDDVSQSGHHDWWLADGSADRGVPAVGAERRRSRRGAGVTTGHDGAWETLLDRAAATRGSIPTPSSLRSTPPWRRTCPTARST